MKSKHLVITVATTTLIVAIAVLARLWRSDAEFEMRYVAYACLHLLITVLLVRGLKVARWAAIALWGAQSIGLMYLGVKQITYSLGGEISSLSLSAVYLVCAVVLLSPYASHYFRVEKPA